MVLPIEVGDEEVDSDAVRRYLGNHHLLQQECDDACRDRTKGTTRKAQLPAKKETRRQVRPPVIQAFSQCLNHFIHLSEVENRSNNPLDRPLGAFESSVVPEMPLEDYIDRIYTYANCSPSCFTVAYVYLKRITGESATSPSLLAGAEITRSNAHRLVLVSIVTTCKFVDDIYYKQNFYAKVGGISTEELNCLEREFLYLLDYKMFVNSTTFANALMELELELELRNCSLMPHGESCIHEQALFRNSFVQPKAC